MREALLAGIALALVVAAFAFSRFFFVVPPQVQAQDQKTFNNEFGLVLKDYSGNDVHLYSYRRQLVIAFAWASWCTYCGDEMQQLSELKKAYGDKIQILAINRAESMASAKGFSDKFNAGSGITLLLDPTDSFFKSIGGYAMPETVFIGEDGNVVFHQRGPIDMPTLQQQVKQLVQ